MTTNEGGGTHPGDPWSPDFKSVAPESPPEDEWPYDESLTLSEAELEIAGLEEDEEAEVDEAAADTESSEEASAAEGAAAQEAEEAAAKEAEEAAAKEAEEAAAKEAEEAAAREREAEEAAAREAEEAEEAAAREAEAAAAKEAEAAAAKEAEEAAAREAEEAEEAAAREAEEAAAKEAEEAAAKEAEEAAAREREAEKAAAREAQEAEEAAAREAEAAAAKEAEEAAAEEVAAKEAEEAAAREAEEAAAKEAAEAATAASAETEPPVALHAVADSGPSINAPMDEVAVEDLQAEPEWLEAVEEMTLDDIAEEGEAMPGTVSAQAETPTEVIESIATPATADRAEETIDDVEFEFMDIDDADLRADTAEHLFEALDIEEAGPGEAPFEAVTGEFEIIEKESPVPAAAVPDPPPVPDIEFEVSPEFDSVSADVDNTRDALAAFMADPAHGDESQIPEVTPAETEPEVAAKDVRPETAAPGQIQLAGEPDTAASPAEVRPLTAEEELIASLSGDLTIPDFETFVQEDFAGDYAPEPTQEHRGLAQTIAVAGEQEASALSASMPGVDHGHVGFQDIDEDLHFDDPDAPETEDETPADDDELRDYGSDLALRAASGIILAALLAATLWAGGVVFLIFIGIVAVTGQIEFYSAVRNGGYRPLVLFGLLGGIGALIGTYAQGSDVLQQGPVAVPAALGFTLVATFAWYGSQEHPPSDPWRNGLVTFLGVAWIPALLALVLPIAEVERSERFQLIIVLLLLVAAFDIGSYFVGRALGSRKFSPVLSPNKTIEGFIGGVVATLVVALMAAAVVQVFDLGSALALAAAIIVAAPLGDLAESLVKRSLGIKDMGQLIPGHGGVLDRIDSYLFAVPLAYLVLRWTGLL